MVVLASLILAGVKLQLCKKDDNYQVFVLLQASSYEFVTESADQGSQAYW